MKYLRPANKKAHRIDTQISALKDDVVALQNGPAANRPHVPMGCTLLPSVLLIASCSLFGCGQLPPVAL